ncbi:MAG: nucleotidyl transferase AbiEii/AbiGii toxin family protein [Lachnospiraceae bacterium]|nr:nucleotidyl transferase AbiEii/AbiGii toxin family protein [Lachnospiraceae bacterium]
MTAIEEMLSKYSLDDEDKFKQAFKETMQEVVLCGLSRGGFFETAAFTGGTALRIIYGIRRFSEDLDFSLLKPDGSFSFEKYLPYVQHELNANGFDIEIGKTSEKSNVKSAFIKADTYKLILNFLSVDPDVFHINKTEKVRVKLEIDTNPPDGANYEESTRLLPSPYIVRSMDLPSMFALKCHAIMCRSYIKGRDYYDYQWFVDNGAFINGKLLKNALFQTEGKEYSDNDIANRLKSVFEAADINEVKKDVRRFLETPEILDNWSNVLFSSTVKDLRLLAGE